jgi:hypothetical protein
MTREQSRNMPSGGWVADGSGVQPGGHVGGDRQIGESYGVRYRRSDMLCAFITRIAYPTAAPGQSGAFFVQVQTEWLTCEDPLDPGGTETWSDTSYDDEPGLYWSIKEAGEAARQVAVELLADAASHDWDGSPGR